MGWAPGLLALALAQVLSWAALFYSFAALLLHWERDLGWHKAELTLGLTAAVLVSAAAAPLAGRILDAGHGRLLLGLSPALGALALCGLCLAETPEAFVALWVVVGLAQAGCLYEALFAFVTLRLGGAARPAILRVTLVAGFAAPVAFLLGGRIAEAAGWRAALLTLAGLALAVAAPLNWFGAGRLEGGAARPARPAARPRVMRRVLRCPAFWLICIGFTCIALDHGILLNHLVPMLAERGIAEGTALMAAACIGPMQVAGRLALLPVEGRASNHVLALLSFLALAAAAGLLLATGGAVGPGEAAALAFGFAGLQGAAYGLTSVLRPALAAETLGHEGFGTVSGWLALPYLLGFALAPTLGAHLWAAGGYDLAILAAQGAVLAGLACLLALRLAAR
ncbi:MFS transporter [Paralimibaculum aggregatum]|uniref:MFS transporter n=1 Tax=Paralimibaculum aggregatum TaxID=3036245 RepID=A0ABQ6LHB1_9RHOB|nr:MFS transporter [Limibaculum sp. NKW23]GMG82681.1 MFS transporter [Limibaculum sp. NKW23]